MKIDETRGLAVMTILIFFFQPIRIRTSFGACIYASLSLTLSQMPVFIKKFERGTTVSLDLVSTSVFTDQIGKLYGLTRQI
jgi:hypothetical protein